MLAQEIQTTIRDRLPKGFIYVNLSSEHNFPDVDLFLFDYLPTFNGYELKTSFRPHSDASSELKIVRATFKISQVNSEIKWESSLYTDDSNGMEINWKTKATRNHGRAIIGFVEKITNGKRKLTNFILSKDGFQIQKANISDDEEDGSPGEVENEFRNQFEALGKLSNLAKNINHSLNPPVKP